VRFVGRRLALVRWTFVQAVRRRLADLVDLPWQLRRLRAGPAETGVESGTETEDDAARRTLESPMSGQRTFTERDRTG
jgi:hypothetical protein